MLERIIKACAAVSLVFTLNCVADTQSLNPGRYSDANKVTEVDSTTNQVDAGLNFQDTSLRDSGVRIDARFFADAHQPDSGNTIDAGLLDSGMLDIGSTPARGYHHLYVETRNTPIFKLIDMRTGREILSTLPQAPFDLEIFANGDTVTFSHFNIFRADLNLNGEVIPGSLQSITNNSSHEKDPIPSPDGSKIVFTGGSNSNIGLYLVNANGSNQQEITGKLTPVSHGIHWA